jgi:hypothetical protein
MEIRCPSNALGNISKLFKGAIITQCNFIMFVVMESQGVFGGGGEEGERRERHPFKSSCSLFSTYL